MYVRTYGLLVGGQWEWPQTVLCLIVVVTEIVGNKIRCGWCQLIKYGKHKTKHLYMHIHYTNICMCTWRICIYERIIAFKVIVGMEDLCVFNFNL